MFNAAFNANKYFQQKNMEIISKWYSFSKGSLNLNNLITAVSFVIGFKKTWGNWAN